MSLRFLLSASALLALSACSGKDDPTPNPTGGNDAPVAHAGTDLVIESLASVPLDGSGSFDPNGDPISFHWAFEHAPADSALIERGPAVFAANGTTSAISSFVPDALGTYVVALVVEDNRQSSSEPDYVSITVESGELPVASAGADIAAQVGTVVTLNGTASYDPAGRGITYSWSWASKPGASTADFSDATSATPSFTPDLAGDYLANLVVDNGVELSAPDTVLVTVGHAKPTTPIADAGLDLLGETCTYLPVDGTGSYDPDGDSLEYAWTVQSVPSGSALTTTSVVDPTAPATSFFADVIGDYVLSLSVTDGDAWSLADLVTVTAGPRTYNTPPTVSQPDPEVLLAGDTICDWTSTGWVCGECSDLVATIGHDLVVSDAEADPTRLSWESIDRDAELVDPNEEYPTVEFTKVKAAKPYECTDTIFPFEVTATDCPGDSTVEVIDVAVRCCGVPEK